MGMVFLSVNDMIAVIRQGAEYIIESIASDRCQETDFEDIL
jgi:hypothetical protein